MTNGINNRCIICGCKQPDNDNPEMIMVLAGIAIGSGLTCITLPDLSALIGCLVAGFGILLLLISAFMICRRHSKGKDRADCYNEEISWNHQED